MSKIIYIFDPLCGWCYGFSRHILALWEKYQDTYLFEVIPGGMVTGNRVGPISDMAEYISNAFKNVEKTSGVRFGKPYISGLLKSDSVIMDSTPPSRAVEVMKVMQPKSLIPYVHALQKIHYVEGKDYNAIETYRELTDQFGLDFDSFCKLWEAEDIAYATKQSFQWTSEAGINGFPATVLEHEGEFYLVAQGFLPFAELEKRLDRAHMAATT